MCFEDELTSQAETIKTLHMMEAYLLEATVRPGYSLYSHTEKVRESMFKKFFKILLASKSQESAKSRA